MSKYTKKEAERQRKYYLKNRISIIQKTKQITDRRRQDPRYRLWRASKNSAKVRNLEHTISIDDICIPDLCPLLKIPMPYGG